jgi:hypothetical protein
MRTKYGVARPDPRVNAASLASAIPARCLQVQTTSRRSLAGRGSCHARSAHEMATSSVGCREILDRWPGSASSGLRSGCHGSSRGLRRAHRSDWDSSTGRLSHRCHRQTDAVVGRRLAEEPGGARPVAMPVAASETTCSSAWASSAGRLMTAAARVACRAGGRPMAHSSSRSKTTSMSSVRGRRAAEARPAPGVAWSWTTTPAVVAVADGTTRRQY